MKVLIIDLDNCCLDHTTPGKVINRAKRRSKMREELEALGSRRTTGVPLRPCPPPEGSVFSGLGVPVTPPDRLYTGGDGVVRPLDGTDATPMAESLDGTGDTLSGAHNLQWWEAQIKGIKGQAVVKFAVALGLKFEMIAPNPGVLCMRARNAIYHWMKQGNLPDESLLQRTMEK